EPPPPYSSTYKDRLYDGEIAYADSALGNLIAYLKARNWYQNALIIVVGDHGEGLGEHREETHGIFLYDATLHVPMILKLPALTSLKKVVAVQMRTPSILPSFLILFGVPQPPNRTEACLNPSSMAKDRPALLSAKRIILSASAGLRCVRCERKHSS